MDSHHYSPTPPREKIVPHEMEAGDEVSCDVCMTQVPASVAVRAEGQDYVRHFCGLECYRKWSQASQRETESPR